MNNREKPPHYSFSLRASGMVVLYERGKDNDKIEVVEESSTTAGGVLNILARIANELHDINDKLEIFEINTRKAIERKG